MRFDTVRHCVMTDGEGHYYLVPITKKPDFQIWLDLTDSAELAYRLPSWAKQIDGVHKLTFSDPREE